MTTSSSWATTWDTWIVNRATSSSWVTTRDTGIVNRATSNGWGTGIVNRATSSGWDCEQGNIKWLGSHLGYRD